MPHARSLAARLCRSRARDNHLAGAEDTEWRVRGWVVQERHVDRWNSACTGRWYSAMRGFMIRPVRGSPRVCSAVARPRPITIPVAATALPTDPATDGEPPTPVNDAGYKPAPTNSDTRTPVAHRPRLRATNTAGPTGAVSASPPDEVHWQKPGLARPSETQTNFTGKDSCRWRQDGQASFESKRRACDPLRACG
jgi:hypothetical protein